MHYYQFRIAEWMLSTAHLTLEEEGVYRRLIDHYYDTEEPIPEETKSVIRRLRLKGYEETVAEILEEFFVLEDGFWHHKRCDKEIEEYHAKAERARLNGKGGGRPPKKSPAKQGDAKGENPEKTQSVSDGNPKESGSKANQEPVTSNQELEESDSAAEAAPPAVIDPHKKSKPKRGTRLPDNWTLTDEYVQAAHQIRPDLIPVLETIAGKFADHWHSKAGKDATKIDWLATWRNWLRNEKSGGSHAAGKSTGNPSYAERRADITDAVTDYKRATSF